MESLPERHQDQLPLFADLGVEALPVGMAGLTQKETRFVLSYLRTGLAATAAREAGYSDPEADASKIRKRPAIAAVLSQASRTAAGNAAALAAGMWQRMQAYRSEWAILYPEVRDLRAKGLPLPCGEDDPCQRNYLDRLQFLEKREREINAEMAKIESTLKGIEVRVDASVDHQHTHTILTPQLTQQLVAARREALATRGN